MPRIQRHIGIDRETTLHVAAAANQEKFVKNLLKWMTKYPITAEDEAENVTLTAQNNNGTTALNFAAAVGNLKIAMEMLNINKKELPNIATRGDNPIKPLFMAASAGHSEMVKLLYPYTTMVGNEEAEIFITCVKNDLYGHSEMVKLLYPYTTMVGNEEAEIFITCVKNDLYGEALQMLHDRSYLARAENNGETALHVLARKPLAFVNESQRGVLRRHINIPWLMFEQENSKQSVANDLFTECLLAYKSDVEHLIKTPVIQQVLFDAARADNIEFLVKLIRFDFDILWLTENDKSIFHIAVEKRLESIFNLLKELSSFGDIIIDRIFENGSNILHLAAELAPQEKLNAISGAALQMQRELLWFKEVEKIGSPNYKEMKNNDGETPYVLFAREHEVLRKEGEKWMTNTATSSMVVATLIGSIMFTGQVADGLNKDTHLFLAYTVSTAISLFGSSTSLIMFLSILISRYSYEDFLVWLPVRLMIGVASLYISIIAMMISFATSFWLKNYNHRDVIFVVISLFACVPIMDVFLKYHLVFDMVQSTFFRFRPRHRLLYEEVSNAHGCRSQSDNPAHATTV
nr:hypothetical protein CFP56_70444 [Quercus suber]